MPTATGYLEGLTSVFGRILVTDAKGTTLSLDEGIGRIVALIEATRRDGHKIMLIGNGGSAAIVSHMQNDLCKCVGARAFVFDGQPLLTALANDDGYESVFEAPVKLWTQAGDLMIAVSSSGQSPNILRGVAAAAERGCRIVTLSGFQPTNALRTLGELNVYVAADTYGYVEMTHSILGHCITDFAAVSRPSDPSPARP